MHPPFGNPGLFRLLGGFIHFILYFGGAFLLLWYYLRETRKAAPPQASSGGNATILTLRLQACERLVLFLERIHPSGLVMRLNDPGLSAAQMHALLVRTIREEFEYNLSQQLYISSTTWEHVRNAKEETIALMNQAIAGLPEDAASPVLVQRILDLAVSRGKLPVESALDLLKTEIQKEF